MNSILKLLFSRVGIIAVCILVQFIWLIATVVNFSRYSMILNTVLTILSIIIVFGIMKREKHLNNKTHWIILILLFPLFGGLLYVLMGANFYSNRMLRKMNEKTKKTKRYLVQNSSIIEEIKRKDEDVYGQIKYISRYVGYPVYKNNVIEYYPIGEEAYKVMLEELKKAKKFIFIEYFIIAEGNMWQGILDILEQKVQEGVEVRVIYDDFGSIGTLPYNYKKTLEAKGIKCVVFNKLKPIIAVIMNNRDHRKIMVIDGNVAFSGGMNIADEYINEKERFGHWKDNGIMVKGEATWNFTVMFLKIWNSYRDEDKDFYKFGPTIKEFEEENRLCCSLWRKSFR